MCQYSMLSQAETLETQIGNSEAGSKGNVNLLSPKNPPEKADTISFLYKKKYNI